MKFINLPKFNALKYLLPDCGHNAFKALLRHNRGTFIAKLQLIKSGEKRSRERWRNFTDWFNWVIMETEVYDYRYPVKGAYVWSLMA